MFINSFWVPAHLCHLENVWDNPSLQQSSTGSCSFPGYLIAASNATTSKWEILSLSICGCPPELPSAGDSAITIISSTTFSKTKQNKTINPMTVQSTFPVKSSNVPQKYLLRCKLMQCRVFLLVARSQSFAVLLWGHVADVGTATFHSASCCTPGTLHSEQWEPVARTPVPW